MALVLVAASGVALYLAQRGRVRASDAIARVSEKKAEALLNASVAALGRKLEQARNKHEPLEFMPKSYRDHLLKDIDELSALI